MTRPVIVDTDPGVNDALAILMALASPELDVLALTTIFGNAATDITNNNALTILETVGRSEIPAAAEATRPIAGDYLGPVPQVHGENGLGGTAITEPHGSTVDRGAAELIYQTACARPGALTLLALGPLTNLAVAPAEPSRHRQPGR